MKKKLTAAVSMILLITLMFCGLASADGEHGAQGYRFFYNQLNVNQQKIYNYILDAEKENAVVVLTLDDAFSGYEEIRPQVGDVYSALIMDFPLQTAWLEMVNCDECDVESRTVTLRIERSLYFREKDHADTEAFIAEVAKNADPGWSSQQKALYISEFVIAALRYDADYQLRTEWCSLDYYDNQVSSILNGWATCEGYSSVFKVLADAIGLDCIKVGSKGHAFNYVRMEDGNWYGVEPQRSDILKGSNEFCGVEFLPDGSDQYEAFEGAFHGEIRYPSIAEDNYAGESPYPSHPVLDIEAERSRLQENSGAEYQYAVNEDGTTITITGYHGPQEGDLIVPREIAGYRVTKIGNGAFAYCKGFTGSLVLPDGITSIGNNAFAKCTGLTEVPQLPGGLVSIGECAFLGCSHMKGNLVFPESLKMIGQFAFRYCTGMEGSLILPSGIESIGTSAFYDCNSLSGTLFLPDGLQDWNAIIGGLADFESVDVSENNPYFTVIDGMLFSKDETKLLYCPYGRSGAVSIPEGTQEIGSEAFYRCRKITELIIPDSVEVFGYRSCAYLFGLESPLHLPSGMKTVREEAFMMTKLEDTICLPGDIDIASGNDFWGIQGCRKVILSDGITELPAATFCCSELESIYIPASVERIAPYCFDGISDLVILGEENSCAQAFAQENGLAFFIRENSVLMNLASCTLDIDGIALPNAIRLYPTNGSNGAEIACVRWETSDPGIAAVDGNGNVTAMAVGDAVITAYTSDGRSCECRVRCGESCKNVHFFPGENLIYNIDSQIGGNINDGYDYRIYQGVEWTIDDTDVADFAFSPRDTSWVTIIPKKTGTFQLTVTGPDGASDSLTFSILDPAETVLIPEQEVTLVYGFPGYDRVQKKPVFLPEGAGAGILYSETSDSAVAYPFPDFWIEAWGVGRTTIRFRLTDGRDIRYYVNSVAPLEFVFPEESDVQYDEAGYAVLQVPLNAGGVAVPAVPASVIEEDAEIIYYIAGEDSVAAVDRQTGMLQINQKGTTQIAAEAQWTSGISTYIYYTVNVVDPQAPSEYELILPESTDRIAEEAFLGAAGFASVKLPESCRVIGARAFALCTGMKYICIPNGQCEIAENAFEGCGRMTFITDPDGAAAAWAEAHGHIVIGLQ